MRVWDPNAVDGLAWRIGLQLRPCCICDVTDGECRNGFGSRRASL